MLKTANEIVAQGDLRAAVDYAIELNREFCVAKRELAVIKDFLRKTASKEGSRVSLEGNIGVAFVAFPDKEVKPRKGVDLREIEVNLTPETFARLFTRQIKVKPAEDFLAKMGALTAAERAVIDRFCEIIDPTGKVNLPR